MHKQQLETAAALGSKQVLNEVGGWRRRKNTRIIDTTPK